MARSHTKLTADTYVRRYSKHLQDPLTADEITAAEAWYEDAAVVATKLGEYIEADTLTGACILSAFSIRTRWTTNVEDAWAYVRGEIVAGLPLRRVIADAALVHGLDAFNQPKTLNFARAIAGDTDAVVIDVWMTRAAGVDRDAPTPVMYRNMATAIRRLAKRYGMTPRGMQALIWGRVRGSLI